MRDVGTARIGRRRLSKAIWRRVWTLQSITLILSLAATLPWLSLFLSHTTSGEGPAAAAGPDLPGALASPGGLFLLALLAMLWIAIELLGHSAQFVVAHEVLHRRKITVPSALALVARHFKGLLALVLRFALQSVAIASPFLLVAITVLRLQLHQRELDYYLTERPPEFLLALALAGLLLLGMILTLVRHLIDWLLAVPLLLFHGEDSAGARRNSRRLASAHRSRLFVHLLGWLAIPPLATSAFAAASLPPLLWTARLIDDRVGLTSLVLSLALALAVAVGLIARFICAAFFSACHARLCLRAGLDEGASDAPPAASAKVPWAFTWAAALVIIATLAFTCSWLERMESDPAIAILVPRGDSVVASESTPAAIESAILAGAHRIEFDSPALPGGKIHIFRDTQLADSVVLIRSGPGGTGKLGAWPPDWRVGRFASSPPDALHGLDVDLLAVRPSLLSRHLTRQAENAGIEIYAWSVNEGIDISSAISRGARGIITQRPRAALRVLDEHAQLNPAERILLDMLSRIGLILDKLIP